MLPSGIDPRRHHYAFAHIALRDVFHEDPARLFALFAGEGGDALFEDLWRSVAEWTGEQALPSEGLHGERVEAGDDLVLLVWLPAPEGLTECHAVALVLQDGGPRYLTLERGASGNVLGGWVARGEDFAHVNYGDGPAPADFAESVRAQLFA